jgi:uncharacterized caspase-like protein
MKKRFLCKIWNIKHIVILLFCMVSLVYSQKGSEIFVGQMNTKQVSKAQVIKGAINRAKTTIALASADMAISLYNANTFTQQKSISGQSIRSNSIVFSHDGNYIVSAGNDGSLYVWNTYNASLVTSIKTGMPFIVGITSSRTNASVAASVDGTLKLFDITGGREINSYTPSARDVTSLAVDASGGLCALGTGSGNVYVYDLSESRDVTVLPLTTNRVTSLQFSSNNRYLAAGGADGSLKLWEIPSWKQVSNIPMHQLGVSSIAFDSRSMWLASSAVDNTLNVTYIASPDRRKTIRDDDGYCLLLSFLNDETLCGGTSKGYLKSWKVLETSPDASAPMIVMLQPLVSGENATAKVSGKEFSFEGIVYDDSVVKRVMLNEKAASLFDLEPTEVSLVPPRMKGKKFKYTLAVDPLNLPLVEIKAFDAWENVGTLRFKLAYLAGNQSIELLNPQQEASESDKSSTRLQFKVWFDIASYKIENNLTEIVNKRNVRANVGDVITEEISLVAGFNQIQITATSKTGERVTKSITINRKLVSPTIATIPSEQTTPTARKQSIEPQRWAVVIGVSRYADQNIPSLKYADADAQAFAEFLQTPQGGSFEPDHMRVLINEEATIANVKDAMYNFLLQAIDIDYVIIYFAGHGAPNPMRLDQLYLLTYDSNPNLLGTTAFPMWELPTVLERVIAAKKVVVFSDACHSGGITTDLASTRGMSLTKSNPVNQYLTSLSRSKEGFVVFTASGENEVSQELPEFGHGVFTYYLLDGMKGAADVNNDYTITINELMYFVEVQVKRKTKGAQNPTRSQTRYDKDLPISIILH